jgi:hypothetical protein
VPADNIRTRSYLWHTASVALSSKMYAPTFKVEGSSYSRCEQALYRSVVCRSRTKAIIFLGTPHRGSTYAEWGTIASNLAQIALQDSNKKIIKTLEVNSEVLDNIHEEFKTIVHRSGIRIHSFQEARGISGMNGLDNKVDCSILPPWPLPHQSEMASRSWMTFLRSSIFHGLLRQSRVSTRIIWRWSGTATERTRDIVLYWAFSSSSCAVMCQAQITDSGTFRRCLISKH